MRLKERDGRRSNRSAGNRVVADAGRVGVEDKVDRKTREEGLPGAEARLLEQIRAGETEAGHRFVREHYPGIYHYLLYLTGQAELAADLTQETFLQAWRHLDTFQGRAALRTWLHRIARREFLQALRCQRAHATLDEMAEIA